MLTVQEREPGVLSRFFFEKEVPYGLALMRLVLPWVLLINVAQRWRWARELYSTDGAPAQLADNFGLPGWLPEYPGAVTVALFTALAFFLVSSSIGWCTRFSLLASTLLYTYFGLLDCMSTITKYTVIATHLLLLLGLSECGLVWSVDAWLQRRRSGRAPALDELRVPVWPQRLLQLLLGFVYFGAAITKMHTPAFFSGDQLMYWMMTYINNVHPLGDLLAQYPLALSAMGYVTIVWEIVFLFTVFQPRFKWPVLAIGTVFHIMTAFTLGLFIFPAVMIAAYLAFLTEAEMLRLARWPLLRRGLAAWPAASAAAASAAVAAPSAGWRWRAATAGGFAMTLAFVCLAGVEVEHWIDPYRERGPGGPLALRELSQEEVDRYFSPDIPLRNVDKLLAFDLGTVAVGEHLLDRRREFQQGESIIAQFSFSPPHEDLWVDAILSQAVSEEGLDGTPTRVPGKLLNRQGQIMPRENFRGSFVFHLDESAEPGEYFLRLRAGNEEIARRLFTLKPRVAAPAAN